MADTKVAVIFYSSTGNTHALAEAIADGAREAGAEVRVKKVAELAPEAAINSNPTWKAYHEQTLDFPVATLDDLEWADAIVIGTPTRFGVMAAQVKQFLDQTGGLWFQGKLANKVASAFVTASNPHGGQEMTILSMNTVFYHWGAIVVAPGYTDQSIFAAGGNPYGASGTNTPSDQERTAAVHLGRRAATVAGWVKVGSGATV